MDTSKQYIEMCDCPEIQGLHSEAEGNLYAARNYIVVTSLRMVWDATHRERFIWLPRQDQLQAMVDNDFDGFVWYVDGCYGTGVDEFSVDNKELPSMEQLWLKFVMGEKYNKFWDDVWVDRV